MTWPQAFFYCFLALLAAPIVYVVVCIFGIVFVGWADDGFWPFNRKVKTVEIPRQRPAERRQPEFPGREEMAAKQAELTAKQYAMCHDQRCPGRHVLKHRCHDLDCKEHAQRTAV